MTDAPQRLSLRSLTDLVEVIPCLLGFHPHDSLVVLAIEGDTLRLTARTDLPDGLGFPPAVLTPVWRRFPDADLVVVACCTDPRRAWGALGDVDRALPPFQPRLLLHADGARWFDDPDAPGVAYDAVSGTPLVEAAAGGRPIRSSRAELEALVEPAHTPAEVTASVERVAERLVGLGDLCQEALALLHAHDHEPGDLEIDDATLICLASQDPHFLEAAILSTDSANAAQRVAFWLQVVRASVPSWAGPALAALGLAAWVSGDGALQVVCLEAVAGRRGPAAWLDVIDLVNADAVDPAEWPSLRETLLADRVAP